MAWVSEIVASVALKRAVACQLEGIEIAPEESPVGAHAANGHVEGAIRRVAGQIRCLKDAAEFKYKVPISTTHLLSQSCSRPYHEIRLRQGRPHSLETCTWKTVQEQIASVLRMLHVHVGTGQVGEIRKN